MNNNTSWQNHAINSNISVGGGGGGFGANSNNSTVINKDDVNHLYRSFRDSKSRE